MTDEQPTELVLGPDEIVNYPLRRATRGYAVREVDDLLDQLAVQTQDVLQQLARVTEERDQLRAEVAEASETESTLKRTLVTAQRAAEASVAEAREEADRMRSRASQRIEKMLATAAAQAHEMREAALRRARAEEADIRRYRRDVEEHIEELRTFAADHRARLAHHLELQHDRLAQMELPEPPPEPELSRDEVLDDDLEVVDVAGIVEELARDAELSPDGPDDGPAPADDVTPEAPVAGTVDVDDGNVDDVPDDGDDTAESLFDS